MDAAREEEPAVRVRNTVLPGLWSKYVSESYLRAFRAFLSEIRMWTLLAGRRVGHRERLPVYSNKCGDLHTSWSPLGGKQTAVDKELVEFSVASCRATEYMHFVLRTRTLPSARQSIPFAGKLAIQYSVGGKTSAEVDGKSTFLPYFHSSANIRYLTFN